MTCQFLKSCAAPTFLVDHLSFPLFYFYCRWKRKLIKKQFTSIIRVHKHCITMHAFQLYLFFYNTSTNMLTEIILNCFHCVSLLRKYDINWRKIVVITFFSLLLKFHFKLEVPSRWSLQHYKSLFHCNDLFQMKMETD